ncbi:MAG TPA: hypothetical protein VE978_26890 [Chitinophagales bacterium]|nr:hypothetical protein [Chitinophagales bacterium]
MKTRLIAFLLIIFCSLTVKSQYYIGKKKTMQDFIHCPKMKVVLTGEPNFDSSLKNAVQQFWKLKEVEFVTDVAEKKEDVEGQIYMIFIEYSTNFWFGKKLMIVDREKPSQKIIYCPVIAGAAFDDFSQETDLTAAAWRLDFVVKGLNDAMQIMIDNNYTGLDVFDPVANKVNIKASVLKTKILLISKQEVNAKKWGWGFAKTAIPMEVFDDYPYEKRVAEAKGVSEAIDEKDERYCLFMPVYSDAKFVFVYDLQTKETVYVAKYDGLSVFNLNKNDIRDLVDAITGKYLPK